MSGQTSTGSTDAQRIAHIILKLKFKLKLGNDICWCRLAICVAVDQTVVSNSVGKRLPLEFTLSIRVIYVVAIALIIRRFVSHLDATHFGLKRLSIHDSNELNWRTSRWDDVLHHEDFITISSSTRNDTSPALIFTHPDLHVEFRHVFSNQ